MKKTTVIYGNSRTYTHIQHKSSQYFCMYNISLETTVQLLSKYIVSFNIEVGVNEKFAIM